MVAARSGHPYGRNDLLIAALFSGKKGLPSRQIIRTLARGYGHKAPRAQFCGWNDVAPAHLPRRVSTVGLGGTGFAR